MTLISILFPSKYLAAPDLNGKDHDVTIKRIVEGEEVGEKKDKCPVVYFDEVEKGLVLNRTNGNRIAKLYGKDTADWIGHRVTLYPSECDYKGEVKECLRVRPDAPKSSKPSKLDADELTDEEREELAALTELRRLKKAKQTVAAS